MNSTLLFDLDGLLADFVGGVLKHFGREDVHISRVPWGIEEFLGIAANAFWPTLDYSFWAGLKPWADGLALLHAAKLLVGPDRIGLLTSACLTPGCADGKRWWVQHHIPEFAGRLIVVYPPPIGLHDKGIKGGAKELIAGPGKILIDDHDRNVDKFIAAGGRALLVPRPWNRASDHCKATDGSFDVARVYDQLMAQIEFTKAAPHAA